MISIQDNQYPIDICVCILGYIINSYQNMICTRLARLKLVVIVLRSCLIVSGRWSPWLASLLFDAVKCFEQCSPRIFFFSSFFSSSSFFLLLLLLFPSVMLARGWIVSRDSFLLFFFDSLLRGKETTNYCQ